MASNPDVSTDRRLLKIPPGVQVSSAQVLNETNENPSADNSYTVGTSSLRWSAMAAQAYLTYLGAGDAQSAAAFGLGPGGLPGLALGAGGASAADIFIARTAALTFAPSADGTVNSGSSANRWAQAHAVSFYSEKAAGDFFPVTRLGWDALIGFGVLEMGPGGATGPDVFLGRFVANAFSPLGSQTTSLGDPNRWFNQVWATSIANRGTAVQAGSTTQVTDGLGNLTVTFPNPFFAPPTAVTATVNGANYAVRIVSKSTTTAVFKILSPTVAAGGGSALTSITDVNSGSFKVFTSSSGLWAASGSGGATTTQFEAINLGAAVTITPVTSHTSNSSGFVTSVSSSFTAAGSVSVTVDWIAVA